MRDVLKRQVSPVESNVPPEVVVLRLPLYLRCLRGFLHEGIEVASSHQLGKRLQTSSAQVRKDLNYFGTFGKQGIGYSVKALVEELQTILGLDHTWNTCLVGAGRLGQAIINYPGFRPEGFRIVVAFDDNPVKVGNIIGEVDIQPMAQMPRMVQEKQISIGIVAVPGDQAQRVVDQLVSTGILGILNYAPVTPKVPENVVIRHIDPVLSLQSMTFYLNAD